MISAVGQGWPIGHFSLERTHEKDFFRCFFGKLGGSPKDPDLFRKENELSLFLVSLFCFCFPVSRWSVLYWSFDNHGKTFSRGTGSFSLENPFSPKCIPGLHQCMFNGCLIFHGSSVCQSNRFPLFFTEERFVGGGRTVLSRFVFQYNCLLGI